MADSIPSLRRKLDEANAEIERLTRAIREPQVKTIYSVNEVPVEVERIVYVDRIVEIPVHAYVDNPDHIATINALKERVCQLESLAQSEPSEEK